MGDGWAKWALGITTALTLFFVYSWINRLEAGQQKLDERQRQMEQILLEQKTYNKALMDVLKIPTPAPTPATVR